MTEEELDLTQIQGDILVGLQKLAQLFVGFVIQDVARFKAFLRGLHLTTASEAHQTELRLDAFQANGGKGMLDIRGTNIAFTIDGLRKLGVADLDLIKDAAFKDGLAARSASLNDPPEGDGAVANWLVGNGVGELDGLLLLTGNSEDVVRAMLGDLDTAAGEGAWETFFVDLGRVREAQPGHEHFGFLDGVSQPAVRGRIEKSFPAETFLFPSQNPEDPMQGLPGADLHWPGAFVFGYASQDRSSQEKAGPAMDGGLPWMRNGSFMVYRRLEQLVPEFKLGYETVAAKLGEDPEILAARMVGRFRSGAPVSLTPNGDDPALGGSEMKNNNFEFGPDDLTGSKCPYAAHIRKAYPRNDLTPAAASAAPGQSPNDASEADTQTHRVMRRGIPFGVEVQPDESAAARTTHSRGLMFVCYQTSIENQFEFISKFWVDNPTFAIQGAGFDPILGQAEGSVRTRTIGGLKRPAADGAQGPVAELPIDFIRPTGGGYFFMPSVAAVRSVLTA